MLRARVTSPCALAAFAMLNRARSTAVVSPNCCHSDTVSA